MRSWVVYTLVDPRHPELVRYVGVTHQKPPARLAGHLHLARKGHGSYLFNWIRKLSAAQKIAAPKRGKRAAG